MAVSFLACISWLRFDSDHSAILIHLSANITLAITTWHLPCDNYHLAVSVGNSHLAIIWQWIFKSIFGDNTLGNHSLTGALDNYRVDWLLPFVYHLASVILVILWRSIPSAIIVWQQLSTITVCQWSLDDIYLAVLFRQLPFVQPDVNVMLIGNTHQA